MPSLRYGEFWFKSDLLATELTTESRSNVSSDVNEWSELLWSSSSSSIFCNWTSGSNWFEVLTFAILRISILKNILKNIYYINIIHKYIITI